MSKLSFLEGFFLTFIIGIPLSFYNPLIATFVAVFLGSLVAGSKKGGGFIGLFVSPQILLAPYIIPIIVEFYQGKLGFLNLALLILPILIDIRHLIIAIAGMIIGIIAGWLSLKFTKKKEEEIEVEDLQKLEI